MSESVTNPASAVSAQLKHLEASDLIRQAQTLPELEYIFRHALVQDAAYSSLLRQDRKRLHQAVGAILEQLYESSLAEHAAVLATHFREAGDDERSFKYYTVAAKHAASIYANIESSLHYEYAIEIAQRNGSSGEVLSQLVIGHGRVLELSARYDEALAHYDELLERGLQSGDMSLQLEALMRSATIHSIPSARFNPGRGEAESRRALELARMLGNRKAEARIWWNLQLVLNFTRRHKESVVAAETSLAISRELNLREQMAYTLNDANNSYILTGQLDRALAVLLEARALWRELGNLPMLADNLNSSAERELVLGNLDQSLQLAQEGYDLSLSISNMWGQSYSLMLQSVIFFERAHISRAFETMSQCIRLSQQSGFIIGALSTLSLQGLMYCQLGLIEPGMRAAQTVTAGGDQLPDAYSWGMALQSMLYCAQGDLEQARVALQDSMRNFDPKSAFSPIEVYLAPAADVTLALAGGELARALQASENAIASIQASGMLNFLVDIQLLKGQILRRLGRLPEALQVLNAAIRTAESRECKRLFWVLHVELSQVEMSLGNMTIAEEQRMLARAQVNAIAAEIDQPDLRQAFLDLPAVRNLTPIK